MKQEYKEWWINALRSGEYEQGHGALRVLPPNGSTEKPRHCCLGVLCNKIIENTKHDWAGQDKCSHHANELDSELIKNLIKKGWIKKGWIIDNINGLSGGLDLNFMELIGITNDEQSILIHLNDEDKRPFSEIADWIEANL